MIGVLDGVDVLTLEHTIWLYLHPIPHCRAQRFAGCASVQVMNAVLLTDAKIPKDVSEHFVSGDLADDGAEVVDGLADVLGG